MYIALYTTFAAERGTYIPEAFWHPLVYSFVSSPLLLARRFRLLCRVLYFAPVEGLAWYSGAVYVTRKYFMQKKNCRHIESRRLISGTIPRVINDFVLFVDSARKGHLQKALTLKYEVNANDDVHIMWYTRRPRNEVISICFIMQLPYCINFRSFSRRKDILSCSFLQAHSRSADRIVE